MFNTNQHRMLNNKRIYDKMIEIIASKVYCPPMISDIKSPLTAHIDFARESMNAIEFFKTNQKVYPHGLFCLIRLFKEQCLSGAIVMDKGLLDTYIESGDIVKDIDVVYKHICDQQVFSVKNNFEIAYTYVYGNMKSLLEELADGNLFTFKGERNIFVSLYYFYITRSYFSLPIPSSLKNVIVDMHDNIKNKRSPAYFGANAERMLDLCSSYNCKMIPDEVTNVSFESEKDLIAIATDRFDPKSHIGQLFPLFVFLYIRITTVESFRFFTVTAGGCKSPVFKKNTDNFAADCLKSILLSINK